ncbi:cytochrome P450 CYP94D108-like [Rosa rugosa]|uniref:cytochrome P450 CYP94D108-like n=1 Tax=Rosa rugosa TaxID=74645 RepID=UPI002B413F35|nr:cytochrome P450 CYP94D108-like [Rosa rugosa]
MDLLFSLQSFLFLVFLSVYVYLHFYTTPPKKSIHTGFKIYPILGSLPGFLKNRHRFLDWTTEILRNCPTNTAVFFRPGKINGIITANPSNVEHMLKTNFENYPKGELFIYLLRDFLGGGIFNADGELWKVQRKTASYAFNTKSLRNFVMDNVSFEIHTRLVPLLARAAETGCRLDLQDVLERFAFDNICKMAFNVDPGCLGGDGKSAAEFMRAFDDAATLCSGRFLYAFRFILILKKFFNIGSERRLKDSIATVHNFADDIIRSRMENNSYEQQDDLLSRFIGNDNINSPEFLRDIIISMILAGRDTTSSALSWFFWILSSRPNVQFNILNELEAIRSRNGQSIGDTYGFDELRDMHYLQAAIMEAMRLYPPVPVDTKECLNDDVMPDGTVLRKGWFVTYHAYAMGRMETIWGKDCQEYVPERWLGEDGTCQPDSAFRYPVFHAGPRMCLGKDLAFIQMKSIAASVIERFEVDVEDKGTCPVHLLSMTLRIKGGLPVSVRKRCI